MARANGWTVIPDHPRGCGDHSSPVSGRSRRCGPPPRVRGPRATKSLRRIGSGTTPAGAGTTGRRSAPTRAGRDHPRGCGDHPGTGDGDRHGPGPPPRVRGPRTGRPVVGGPGGTTPAGAGTTQHRAGRGRRDRDHPRGCGDHTGGAIYFARAEGPPPRVRGPRPRRPAAGRPGGTTPAGAGTTSIRAAARATRRDHPRGCGDHTLRDELAGMQPGPPPRVRARLRRHRHLRRGEGTTPAGAGTTDPLHERGLMPRDHPRGCGDHPGGRRLVVVVLGPPPRVRGPRWSARPEWRRRGTTPAGAGTTPRSTARICPLRDHPRGCGDHETSGGSSRPPTRDHPRGCGDHRRRPATSGELAANFTHFAKG